jgi:hypothetical protein
MRESPLDWLTKKGVAPDWDGSLSYRFRARRWQTFAERFPAIEDMTVLDLGGTVRAWDAAPARPQRLVLLNVFPQQSTNTGVETIVGDACSPPESVRREHFDLVFSNSVIDQVGGHARRGAFAEQVQTLADHHWIQTAYRYFPINPFWLFPAFQFLPVRARVALTRWWPLGSEQKSDPREATSRVLTIEMLSETELRYYFPHSEIWRERVFGIVKSLVAIA